MHLQCKHLSPHASCSPFREDFPESIGEEFLYPSYVIHLELTLTMDTTLCHWSQPGTPGHSPSTGIRGGQMPPLLVYSHTTTTIQMHLIFLRFQGSFKEVQMGKEKGHTLSVRCSNPRGLDSKENAITQESSWGAPSPSAHCHIPTGPSSLT